MDRRTAIAIEAIEARHRQEIETSQTNARLASQEAGLLD
jgi:predicted transcriptional regulator